MKTFIIIISTIIGMILMSSLVATGIIKWSDFVKSLNFDGPISFIIASSPILLICFIGSSVIVNLIIKWVRQRQQ